MSQLGNIKSKLKDKLNELVDAETLREVVVLNPNDSSFNVDARSFPVAILSSPSSTSSRVTNRDNERIHTFEIVVLVKHENVTGDTYFEDLIETILDKFDNNETLGGLCIAIEPSYSEPQPVPSGDKSISALAITLDIRMLKTLT